MSELLNPYLVPINRLPVSSGLDFGAGSRLRPFGRSYYCENDFLDFEIQADGKLLMENAEFIDVLSNVNKYNCHICNIEVPYTHSKDHNVSVKHRSFAKIVDISLTRARAQMAVDQSPPMVSVGATDTYFCDACVKIISNNKKDDHEKSTVHVKSLKHDTDLAELVKVLNEESVSNENVPVNSVGANEMDVINVETVNECNNEVCNKIDGDAIGKKKTEKQYYCYTAIMVQDYVELNVNAHKFKVPMDNFHGFLKMNGGVQCRLCGVQVSELEKDEHINSTRHIENTIKPITNVDCVRKVMESLEHCILCNVFCITATEHISITSHKNKVKELLMLDSKPVEKPIPVPLNTKTEVVKVKTDNKTYCAPCSIFIDTHNYESHLNGAKHKTNYQNTMVGPKQVDKKSDTATVPSWCNSNNQTVKPIDNPKQDQLQTSDTVFCDTCKVNVPKKGLDVHNDGARHKSNLKTKPVKAALEESSVHPLIYLLRPSNDKYLKCRICNVDIAKTDVKMHLSSGLHEKLYENKIKSNQLKKTGKSSLECKVCKQTVAMGKEIDHIEDSNHGSKLKSHERKNVPTKANQNGKMHYHMSTSSYPHTLLCRICGINVFSSENNVNDHVTSIQHWGTYERTLKSNHLQETADSTYYCHICDCVLAANEELDHIGLETHKNSLKLVTDVATNNIPAPHYHMRRTVNGKLVCKLCSTELTDSKSNVETHLLGNRHLLAHKKLIETNHLESEINGNFSCSCCKVQVKNNDELDHIAEKNHKANLKLHEDAINVTPKLEDETITKTSNVDTAADDVHYHFYVTNNKNELLCKICKMVVPNLADDVNRHVKGFWHQILYENLLKSNKFSMIGENLYYCDCCKHDIPLNGELEHTILDTHTANMVILEKPTSTNQNIVVKQLSTQKPMTFDNTDILRPTDQPQQLFCVTCQKKVPNTDNNIQGHLNGQKHRQLYSKLLEENHIKEHNETTVECACCEITVNAKNIVDHIQQKTHEFNLKVFNKSANEKLALSWRKKDEADSIDVEDEHYYLINTSNPKLLLCPLCNKIVPKNKNLIELHLKGNRHSTSVLKMVESNQLVKNGDSCYKCLCCEVNLEADSEIVHIELQTHKDRLNSFKNVAANEMQENTEKETYSDHLSSISNDDSSESSIETPENEVSYDHNNFVGTSNSKELFCKVCCSIVPNMRNNINEHVLGRKHKSLCEELAKSDVTSELYDGL